LGLKYSVSKGSRYLKGDVKESLENQKMAGAEGSRID
jgi:hypothetical protein